VTQKAYGASTGYLLNHFSAGSTFFIPIIQFLLNRIISRITSSIPRNYLNNYGVHLIGNTKFQFFGEGAKSDPGGLGGVTGMLISVDPRVDLAFVYRNYSKNFYSAYSNAFGESSTNNNERGLYSGIIIRPAKSWELDAYADLFKRPWLAYQVDAPSIGTDYLVQLNYRPKKNLRCTCVT
jgi:hypothetical protein